MKVVRRTSKTPGTVSVNGDGDTNISDFSSIMNADETNEMHHLYANITYEEKFNKHVSRSIRVCLKDRVFPKVKFWKDTKATGVRFESGAAGGGSVSTSGMQFIQRHVSLALTSLINPNWVLLDSESTVNVFRNRRLLTDVMEHPLKECLCVYSTR